MMRIKILGTFLIAGSILGIVFFTLALPIDLYFFEMSPYFTDGSGFVVSFLPWDVFDWRWALTIPVYWEQDGNDTSSKTRLLGGTG
jgi:hypothetical protein